MRPTSSHRGAVAERTVGGGDQPVALVVQRDGAHPAERFVVEIGQTGVDLEILQHRQHLERVAREDGEIDLRMTGAKRRGQRSNDRSH
jgi:hypothetical protein